MDARLKLALILLLAPIGLFICHAVISRVIQYGPWRSVAPQLVVVSIVLIGNIPVVWLSWYASLRYLCNSQSDTVYGIIYVVLTYDALAFCYFCVLNLSETSLHVHLLMKLLLEGAIPAEELARRYSATEMIAARIERMIALGQLRERDGYFCLTGSALLVSIGKAIDIWRKVLRIPLSP